jgi:hypothetical protein
MGWKRRGRGDEKYMGGVLLGGGCSGGGERGKVEEERKRQTQEGRK